MDTTLLLVGLAKLGFGLLVGALGVFVGSRALNRLLRIPNVDAAHKARNVASATITGAGLLALGILVREAVIATFSAMGLLWHGRPPAPLMVLQFLVYGLVHVSVALLVGVFVLAVGVRIFSALTRGFDELGEIREGKIAPALVLGAVLIALAGATAPGLETMLDGLLPLPTLGRFFNVSPS